MPWIYYCYVGDEYVTSYELNFKIDATKNDIFIFGQLNAILNKKLLSGDTWPNPLPKKQLGNKIIVISIDYNSGLINIKCE